MAKHRYKYLSRRETLTQCCFSAGPPSATANQHWNNIGSTSSIKPTLVLAGYMRGFSTPSDWWREGYLHPEVTKAVCRPFRHRDPRPAITPHGGTRREWLKWNWWARRGERSADVRACRRDRGVGGGGGEVGWIPTPAEHHLICKRPGFLSVHSAGLRVIPIPVTHPPPRFAAWSPLP